MRFIARIDTKMEYVVKGRQLEGVEKQYKLLDAFEAIKSDKISGSIKCNEFLLHDSVASLYRWQNYYLKNDIIPYSGRPLTISGGIRSLEEGLNLAKKCERISINTFCFENLSLVDKLSRILGAQSVSIEIHAMEYRNSYRLLTCNGKETITSMSIEDYLKKLKVHEFGEINLLAVNRDGMFSGLDINLFKIVKKYFPKKSIVLGGGLESFENLNFYQNEGINGIFFSSLFHKEMKKIINSNLNN